VADLVWPATAHANFYAAMPIEADMMLAQVAGLQNGSLMLLGAGWMVRPPGVIAGPVAIGLVIRVPRSEAGLQHQLRLELLDSDDEIVVVDPPNGPGPMIVEADFSAQGLQRDGLTIPLTVPIAINLPPFPLPRGREYRWRAYVDGQTQESWTLPFRTTPPKGPPQR
jgi:hypothetical protein